MPTAWRLRNEIDALEREKKQLQAEAVKLEQLLKEKNRTITHLESNITIIKEETTKETRRLRAEATAAKTSEKFTDGLLDASTAVVRSIRLEKEKHEDEIVTLKTTLEDCEKRLGAIQYAYMDDAPAAQSAAVNAFSVESLAIVKSLKADVARERALNSKLMAQKGGVEELRRQNNDLKAQSVRDNAELQELRRGREADKRTVKAAELGQRSAEDRARVAREIAEQQQHLIEKFRQANSRHLIEYRH